jgi:hypothetical protein
MAFSTKTELSDESFKNTCNMKWKFETIHDIQITEEGITKLLKKKILKRHLDQATSLLET